MKQQEEKQEIAVVLSADRNYAIPMYVTVQSVILHNRDNTVRFYLQITDDFPVVIREAIQKAAKAADMPEPVFIEMHDAYANTEMHIKRITHATYYRLQLPQLLEKVDKCLYLDVDLCVNGDLRELYNLDMGDAYIAGVRAPGFFYPEEKRLKTIQELGIPKIDQYINAGVLLIDLKKMREDNLEARFEELMQKHFSCQDQDILNCACYGRIKILPPCWNVMTKYPVTPEAYIETPYLKLCYTEEEWKNAAGNPRIIHYADSEKPWVYPDGIYGDIWWSVFQVCREAVEDVVALDDLFISFMQTAINAHIGRLKARITELYDTRQDLFGRYQETTAKLHQTYDEKSEINRKLQITYKEKAERGVRIRELEEEISGKNAEIQAMIDARIQNRIKRKIKRILGKQ